MVSLLALIVAYQNNRSSTKEQYQIKTEISTGDFIDVVVIIKLWVGGISRIAEFDILTTVLSLK